uniref:Uncharacterized protein n=1 Tax=Nelumbo nucifera TaxID=4432 RepID=A0A822Y1P7_NELNU|nr:TPA_asm: hypothetical protein HUJ06_027640 [Nelumbo nucifera]
MARTRSSAVVTSNRIISRGTYLLKGLTITQLKIALRLGVALST